MNIPNSGYPSKDWIGVPHTTSSHVADILLDAFEGVKKKCLPNNIEWIDLDQDWPISQKEVIYSSIAFSQADMLGSSFRDPVLNNIIVDDKWVLLKMLFQTEISGKICPKQCKIKTIEYRWFCGKILARKFDSYV